MGITNQSRLAKSLERQIASLDEAGPQDDWTLEQCEKYLDFGMTNASELTEKTITLGRLTAVQVFRNGHALFMVKQHLKEQGYSWEEWWKARGYKKTTIWRARKLYELAGSESSIEGLTIDQAYKKYDLKRQAEDEEDEAPAQEPQDNDNEPEQEPEPPIYHFPPTPEPAPSFAEPQHGDNEPEPEFEDEEELPPQGSVDMRSGTEVYYFAYGREGHIPGPIGFGKVQKKGKGIYINGQSVYSNLFFKDYKAAVTAKRYYCRQELENIEQRRKDLQQTLTEDDDP